MFINRIDEILAVRQKVLDEEVLMKDGRIFERDYVPIFIDMVFRGHMWKYREITQRKRDEEVLWAAKELAEQANRTKDGFLANMSHELRTPLGVILGLTELLLQSPLDTEQLEMAELIGRSGRSLLSLVDDLLDYSKITAGRFELRGEDFPLHAALQQVIDTLAVTARAKGLVLQMALGPTVPTVVHGDATRLGQIVTNLVGNAIKFTNHGHVSVKVDRVGMEVGYHTVQVSVTDSGSGISERVRPLLFRPFSQGEVGAAKGTGLGLAISKQLVELMGGAIDFTSEVGKGSTFVFTARFALAMDRPSLFPHNRPVSLYPPPSLGVAQCRILIAEDDEANRILQEKVLHRLGYQVLVARNGRQAVELAGKHAIAAILMDYQMPELDGYEATRQIRALPEPYCNVPIIALTANAMPDDRARCEQAGMNDYLTKPVEMAKLRETLARWVFGSMSKISLPPLPGNNDEFARLEELCRDEGLGGISLVRDMVKAFCGDMPGRVSLLHEAVEKNDEIAIARQAHRLKGMALSLGVERIAALAGSMERCARNGGAPVEKNLFSELERCVIETSARLHAKYLKN